MIRLFNVEAHALNGSGGSGGISSDGFLNQTQDTQQILDEVMERKRRRPSKDKKGKGKMVIHDDEEEEGEEEEEEQGKEDAKEKEVTRLRKELRETKNTVRDQRNEAEQYRLQCIKLEESLKPLEEDLDLLREENSALVEEVSEMEEQLAGLNADVLEDTKKLLEGVEADNKKLTREVKNWIAKCDRKEMVARERKEKIDKLEQKLKNEGSEGGVKIMELEAEVDELKDVLMKYVLSSLFTLFLHPRSCADSFVINFQNESSGRQGRTRHEGGRTSSRKENQSDWGASESSSRSSTETYGRRNQGRTERKAAHRSIEAG